MRWAALYRRPPVLRGVFASQIPAGHARDPARIIAVYDPDKCRRAETKCREKIQGNGETDMKRRIVIRLELKHRIIEFPGGIGIFVQTIEIAKILSRLGYDARLVFIFWNLVSSNDGS